MAITDKSLVFHSSFPPQLSYVAKILHLAAQNFSGNKVEISNITGIPTGDHSGKVLPHIKYANYMGLIYVTNKEGKINLRLTELGGIVYNEDPYMMEEVTKLVTNFWLTDKQLGAPQWSFLYRIYDSNLGGSENMKHITEKASQFFGKKSELGVVKGTYAKDCFETLNLIYINDSEKEIRFNRLMWKNDIIYVYAYTLLKSWEMYFKKRRELTMNEIIDEIAWNKPFGFDYETSLAVLDELSSFNFIAVNRQLNPVTVIKLVDSEEVLGGLYSLLI